MKKLAFFLVSLFSIPAYSNPICCSIDPSSTSPYCLLLDKSRTQSEGKTADGKFEIRPYELTVCTKDGWFKTYNAVIGMGGAGNKQKQGDQKTPNGTYKIIEKGDKDRHNHSKTFAYDKYFLLDYPNATDKQNAKQGVSLGGGIEIHGTAPHESAVERKYNWTDGCISVNNEDVDDLYSYIPLGTTVEIRPDPAVK